MRFMSETTATHHYATVHVWPRKQYCCLDCSASFASNGHLTYHVKKHREVEADLMVYVNGIGYRIWLFLPITLLRFALFISDYAFHYL